MSPVLDEYGRAPWQDRLTGARQPLSQAQQEEMALRLDPVTKAYGLPDDFGTRGEAPAPPPPAPAGQGVLGNMSPESEARFARAFPQEGRAEYEPPDENLARMRELAAPKPRMVMAQREPLVMAREPDAPPRPLTSTPSSPMQRAVEPAPEPRMTGDQIQARSAAAYPPAPEPEAPSAFQQFMMERARKDDEARAKAEDDRKKQAFARGLSQIGQGLGSAFGGGKRKPPPEPTGW